MVIVILGAGGFIGSHMVQHLVQRGEHQVVGVDVAQEKLRGIEGPNFTFHRADIRTSESLVDDLVAGADVVVDLVAYANPSLYVTNPLEVFDLNFNQNVKVIQHCIRHRVRLVQYSSAEVYGKQEHGDRYYEDASDSVFGPVHKQRWIYASAKMMLERLIYAHGVAGDLEYTVIRPFNFCGSRIDYLVPPRTQGGPRVFAHFMSALLTEGPLQLVDGGAVHRTFLHISDANEAFQTILDQPARSRNQIFNVGNPDNNITIRDLAHLMIDLYAELTGERPRSRIVEVSGETFYGHGYEDSDRLPPDVGKLKALGWRPRHDLQSTLRETMEYYLQEWQRTGGTMLEKTVV